MLPLFEPSQYLSYISGVPEKQIDIKLKKKSNLEKCLLCLSTDAHN